MKVKRSKWFILKELLAQITNYQLIAFSSVPLYIKEMFANKKKMKEFIVTWRIENFSYSWHQTGECIVSPVFQAGPLLNTAWTLKLYPRGIDDIDFLSFSVERQRDLVYLNFLIYFDFSCISEDKSVLNSSCASNILNISPNPGQIEYGESRFIQRYEVIERKALYLPNDILTLRCRMWQNIGDTCEFMEVSAHTQFITKTVMSVRVIDSENNYESIFIIQSDCQHVILIYGKVRYLGDKLEIIFDTVNPAGIKFATCKSSFVDIATGANLCALESCFFGEFPIKPSWLLPIDTKLFQENNINATSKFEFIQEITYSTGTVKSTIEQDRPRRFLELVSKCIGSNGCNCKMRNCLGIGVELWNLYVAQDFCDVELKTQNKSFFVHKVVLCARSPVFLAMLTGEMKEKIKGCIEIEDIKDVNLEIFIKFLYTDLFEGIDFSAAIELYDVAVKYQVKRLRCLCCGYLMKNMNDNKVCELLILAERHNDCELKRKVNYFVFQNEHRIFRSRWWKKFDREHQQLAMETRFSVHKEKENRDLNKTSDVDLSNIRSITDDFRSLLNFYIATDMEIRATNSIFFAHQTVLRASSSTFNELIRNDSGRNVLGMENWEDETILRMLICLYTDSLENTQWDTAVKLYQLARGYGIRRLQIKVSCFLLERLSVTNAIQLLLLTYEHHDVALKSLVVDYICQHDEEIFGSDEWAALCNNNNQLAFTTMSAKYQQNK